MPAAILSQDILAICLLLADGNIDLSMEEVVHRVEIFQEDQDRHFGITRYDFRGLFNYWFMFDLGIIHCDEGIDGIKLKDVAIDVLTYHDAHFNDEGEYWTKEKESWNEKLFMEHIKSWYSYDEENYQEKLIIKKKMKRFFEDQELTILHPEFVMKFMEELKISDTILFYCSRPGKSS